MISLLMRQTNPTRKHKFSHQRPRVDWSILHIKLEVNRKDTNGNAASVY